MNKFRVIIKCITNILLVCYPFIIYLSLHYQCINLAILCLLMFFILRLFTLPNIFSYIRWLAKITACVGLFLAILSWVFTKYQLLLYYPVAVNVLFFAVFCYSLTQPQTIIVKFAKIRHSELSPKAIQYTRKVTLCWCVFFVLNGSIALFTCLLDNISYWTIYNGLISYILIAILMGGEWLIRQKHQN